MEDATSREPFTLLPNWVIRDGILDAYEMAVYLVLLSHRDHKTGTAFPGFDKIKKQSRLSRNTVIRTIPKLEARGLITVTRRKRGNGKNDPNLYKVAVFNRNRSVDNLPPKKGPRFEDDSEDPLGSAPERLPSAPEGPGSSAPEGLEEEPSLTKTNELNIRSELKSGREFSFDVYDDKASQKQLDYLHELFIHFNNETPSEANKSQWASFTVQKAAIVIDGYLSQMARYDAYEGPEEGEDAYKALSPKGQQWADTGFIPDIKAVA